MTLKEKNTHQLHVEIKNNYKTQLVETQLSLTHMLNHGMICVYTSQDGKFADAQSNVFYLNFKGKFSISILIGCSCQVIPSLLFATSK